MARIRKVVTKLNLSTVPVYINDTKSYSDYFSLSQFDRYFTSGKNGFLITGTSYLTPQSEIILELIDSNGNPVFLNPITNYSEGGGRLISVEVYENTPPGPGNLYILGVARGTIAGGSIPVEWANKYNIRWTVPVNIEPSRKNVSIIRFKNVPEIFVTERLGDKQIVTRLIESQSNIQIPIQTQFFNYLPAGYSLLPTSSLFTRDMLGGYITGSITKLTTTQSISASISTYLNTEQTCSIKLPIDRILNSVRAFTGTNIYDQNGVSFPVTVLENGVTTVTESVTTQSVDLYKVYATSISQSNMQIQYEVDRKSTVPGISNVFVDLRIINLNTLSGEIARIKTFVKEPLAQGDYNLVADTKPPPQDFFVSGGVVNTGIFTTASHVDTTWFADFSGSNKYYSGSVTSSINMITGSATKLLDGVTFNIVSPAATGSYFLGTQEPLLFFTGSEYTLSYDVYYAKEVNGQSYITDAELNVYLYGSGSARGINETVWGMPIDSISFVNKSIALIEKREVNFIVKQNGPAQLRFLMSDGHFTYTNIRLKTAEEFGFNSDEVQMVIPLDAYASSSLIFKTEFYDINNNNVNIDTLSSPILLPPTSTIAFGSASFADSASFANSASYASYTPGIATVAFVMNGGAYPLSTGFKGSVRIPTDVTLSEVGIYTSGSGSINIDIRLQTHTTYEPLSSSPASIVGTPLSMSNDTKYLDNTLSGWTTMLMTNDILNFFVLAVDGAELKVATIVFNVAR
jgi:hypothetical protein